MQLYMIRKMVEELATLALPPDMTIRSYRSGDEAHWDRIIQGSFRCPPEETNFSKTMVPDKRYRKENILFVCIDDYPIATATAWETNPELGYVHYVGTDPEYTGRRAGYYVSLAVLHRFREEGKVWAELETDDFRTPAIKIYLRLGFRPHCYLAYHRPVWEHVLKEERLATWLEDESMTPLITDGRPLANELIDSSKGVLR